MIDDYDALVGLIYDGVMDDAPWSLALARVADSSAPSASASACRRTCGPMRSAASAQSAESARSSTRPIGGSLPITGSGRRSREAVEPLTDRMVMPKDGASSEPSSYADWFRPQDFHSVMAFPAPFKDKALRRSSSRSAARRPAISSRRICEVGRFAGHFGRALAARMDREQTFERLAAANFMLDEVRDAILLIDREARPVHANAAARAMLDAGHTIRLCRGRLSSPDPEANARFLHMAALRRDGEIRLAGRDALTLRLHACAQPLGLAGAGCLAVRITDPTSRARAADRGQAPRPIGPDAPPGGSARRARDRGDGEGGGRDPRPRRARRSTPMSAAPTRSSICAAAPTSWPSSPATASRRPGPAK